MSILKIVLIPFLTINSFSVRSSPVKTPSPHLTLLNLGVQVQDTKGNPIEDATISVYFETLHPDFGGFTLKQSGPSVKGQPVRFKERALMTLTVVTKEGYWRSAIEDQWRESINKETGLNVPESEKDILITLRKQHNPRPLYAHRSGDLFLREFDVPYGYDLNVGDFVRPHGKGSRADMVFTMRGELNKETREYDVVTTLSFPNKGDGVLPVKRIMAEDSELLLGQEAPETGYQAAYEMREKSAIRINRNLKPFSTPTGPPKVDEEPHLEGFWFRTHTEIDPETGKVVRARYGKFYSSPNRAISFGFRMETPRVQMGFNIEFIYFYSPDYSRSLEFNGNSLVPNGNLQGVNKR